ncbi:MAG: NADH-quinone oxidoreductase subunit N [Nitrospirae bacterium]|nr:NADH-quinone oxidoreductase subunit N [Nitrospirota bacterium]
MNFQLPDIGPVIPELVMTGLALILLTAELFIKNKKVLAFASSVGVGGVAFTLIGASGTTFGGMFISDGYSTFFKLIFFINAILSILISVKYIAIEKVNFGEYYSLILFSTLGMMIMASAADLIVLYLGLELMALSTYILAGFIRYDVRSNEAALKYFLLGAFSSAFLLYGISMVYGLTGTTDLKAIAQFITTHGLTANHSLLLSMLLIAIAFGFKIAAVPFHMWAPDLSMAVGNIVAIAQTNIKRMLAYSSIAHAGYVLLGVIVANNEGLAGMMTYLMIYAFMNIGAFAVVIMLRTEGFKGEDIKDYEGLAKTHPLLAAIMLIFMFSLAGIPPTAGFIGKLYVFMSAINAGYTWLVIVAVIFSVISAYFYLRIVMYMYMREPKVEVSISTSPSMNLALILTTVAVLAIGVFPSIVVDLARAAISGF